MSILKQTILTFCGGHLFSSLCCPIMCLEYRAVMSVMISSYTRCPARLYLQLFVSYLRYLSLLAHSGVQHILCCFLLWFSSSMLQVPLDCSCLSASSVFSNVYSVIFKDKSLNRHNLFIFILQGTVVRHLITRMFMFKRFHELLIYH
jgi:hypothetical protein